jgi:hypothetical protein
MPHCEPRDAMVYEIATSQQEHECFNVRGLANHQARCEPAESVRSPASPRVHDIANHQARCRSAAPARSPIPSRARHCEPPSAGASRRPNAPGLTPTPSPQRMRRRHLILSSSSPVFPGFSVIEIEIEIPEGERWHGALGCERGVRANMVRLLAPVTNRRALSRSLLQPKPLAAEASCSRSLLQPKPLAAEASCSRSLCSNRLRPSGDRVQRPENPDRACGFHRELPSCSAGASSTRRQNCRSWRQSSRDP